MEVVDSSALIALYNEKDSLHAAASEVLERAQKPLFVPEYVAVETASVLNRKANKRTADAFLRSLFDNRDIVVLPSSAEQFIAAVEAFLTKGGKLSFTDAALLALSRSYSVITFDAALARAIEKTKK